MSITSEIEALATDRAAIQSAILAKGGTVTTDDGFDDFAFAIGTIPTDSGSSDELSSHSISLRLRDNTVANIDVNYDDPLISTMITSYIPETYNNKNVLVGALDGVTWFDLSAIPLDTELIDFTKVKTETMVNNSGAEYQDSNTSSSCCTDFIPIDPNMTFTLMAYHWYRSIFYNEDKQAVGNIYIHDNGTPSAEGSVFWVVTLNSTNIPANAAYIRINTYLEPTAEHMSLIRIA